MFTAENRDPAGFRIFSGSSGMLRVRSYQGSNTVMDYHNTDQAPTLKSVREPETSCSGTERSGDGGRTIHHETKP
ncbi:MAG: hypothetical protein APR53_08515 [Methanoculleus sp. SDB]|nr:MAG: hypothetical protein APR53_08515 [Methanoculleus sp. SDB]